MHFRRNVTDGTNPQQNLSANPSTSSSNMGSSSSIPHPATYVPKPVYVEPNAPVHKGQLYDMLIVLTSDSTDNAKPPWKIYADQVTYEIDEVGEVALRIKQHLKPPPENVASAMLENIQVPPSPEEPQSLSVASQNADTNGSNEYETASDSETTSTDGYLSDKEPIQINVPLSEKNCTLPASNRQEGIDVSQKQKDTISNGNKTSRSSQDTTRAQKAGLTSGTTEKESSFGLKPTFSPRMISMTHSTPPERIKPKSLPSSKKRTILRSSKGEKLSDSTQSPLLAIPVIIGRVTGHFRDVDDPSPTSIRSAPGNEKAHNRKTISLEGAIEARPVNDKKSHLKPPERRRSQSIQRGPTDERSTSRKRSKSNDRSPQDKTLIGRKRSRSIQFTPDDAPSEKKRSRGEQTDKRSYSTPPVRKKSNATSKSSSRSFLSSPETKRKDAGSRSRSPSAKERSRSASAKRDDNSKIKQSFVNDRPKQVQQLSAKVKNTQHKTGATGSQEAHKNSEDYL